MKRIVLLGSTGSIGRSTVRVVQALPEEFRIVGLAVGGNADAVLEQAASLGVAHVAVADAAAARACRAAAPRGVTVHEGAEGVCELASLPEADIVVSAIVGLAGLRPVMAAVSAGKPVALATKEVLVAAGHIVTRVCRESGACLLPVDSEHSAIFQCLAGGVAPHGESAREIARLILTASGGPFAATPDVDFDRVGVATALAHPRWDMGPKVSIDSATLMNKGLEIMEAHWLFGVPLERIDVVIHSESIVHSMVEFVDGAVLAQMSVPDMRFAIQYALGWPRRMPGGLPRLDVARLGALHFGEPDTRRFPCLALAREAAATGGSLPVVLNAANEVAVEKFLASRLRFSGIWSVVEYVMDRHDVVRDPSLEGILAADEWARGVAAERCVSLEK